VRNIVLLRLIIAIAIQKIREEKYFQHDENDEELDENNKPQGFSQFHVVKSIPIEMEGMIEKRSVVRIFHELLDYQCLHIKSKYRQIILKEKILVVMLC